MSITLGQVILPPDLDANKLAPGEPGRLFFATDTKNVYRDTGTIWQTVVAGTEVSFTPVQQGGGAYQGPSKVYLGIDLTDPTLTHLRLQMDASDCGPIALLSDLINTGSGYFWAGGKLIQYGTVPYADNGGSGAIQNFPVAFPNACEWIAACNVQPGSTIYAPRTEVLSTTQFNCFTPNNNGAWWIAIGH